VRTNAKLFGVTEEEELRRVIIHGLLHLCGFQDKTDDERKLMQQAEEKALNSLPH
jgi:rRNA maturation RNase YbeY